MLFREQKQSRDKVRLILSQPRDINLSEKSFALMLSLAFHSMLDSRYNPNNDC